MHHRFIVAVAAAVAIMAVLSSVNLLAADYVRNERSVQIAGQAQPATYLLLTPPDRPGNEKHPLIVHLYGRGGSTKTDQTYNLGMPSYAKFRQLAAQRGYYILIPELGESHWMSDRAEQTLDAIIDHAIADEPIDAKRVHLFGTSMGGGSSFAYAIHRPDMIRSICAIFPISNFSKFVAENPNYLDSVSTAYGGGPAKVPDVWAKKSAMSNLDTFKCMPVYLVHGSADTVVNPDQSRLLAKALRAKHYPVFFHEVEGFGHDDAIVDAFQEEMVDFLDHQGLDTPTKPSNK